MARKGSDTPSTDAKVFQEFYCASSGGGCGGYVLVKLRTSFNGIVKVTCPNCGHEHQRTIEKGRLVEHGRYTNDKKSDIQLFPMKSAFSKKPRHKHHADSAKEYGDERDARVFEDYNDAVAKTIIKQSWFENCEQTG